MKGIDWLRIAGRLEREAGNMKFGTVGVNVQVHDGEVCKIRYNRQDCEAYEVAPKERGWRKLKNEKK